MSFALIMAHEISHVFLYSIRHPQKNNEFFTDFTAITHGFHDVFYNGRKLNDVNKKFNWFTNTTTTSTQTTTYGYLNDNQFAFVSKKILYALKKNREQENIFFKVIKRNEKITAKHGAILLRFKNFFELITQNLNKKISGKDGKIITHLFEPGYMEEIDLLFNSYSSKLEDAQKLYENNFNYTAKRTEKIINISDELLYLSLKANENMKVLKKYVKIMKKYIPHKKRMILYYNYLITRASNL